MEEAWNNFKSAIEKEMIIEISLTDLNGQELKRAHQDSLSRNLSFY